MKFNSCKNKKNSIYKKNQDFFKRKNHNECLGRSTEYFISSLFLEKNKNIQNLLKPDLIDLSIFEKDIHLFEKIKDYYPYLEYIGNSDNKYDFKYIDNNEITKYVSLKTNFNGYKVCPQVIGQTTFKKYKSYFQINENYDMNQMKQYIIHHISDILKTYIKYTFHCDIIYYIKGKNKKSILKIIQYNPEKIDKIDFDFEKITFSHIVKNKTWNESTTLYYTIDEKRYSIGEFQIHNHRDNIKFRWSFNVLLELFDFDMITIDD